MVWLKAWPPWSRQASLRRGRGAIAHMAARSVPGNRGGDFFLPPGSRAPPVTWEVSQLPTVLGEHSKWDSRGGDTNPAPEETASELINKESSESTWALNQSRSHMWPQTAGPAPSISDQLPQCNTQNHACYPTTPYVNCSLIWTFWFLLQVLLQVRLSLTLNVMTIF